MTTRILNEEEKKLLCDNRPELHEQLSELQADFEDFSDKELLNYRDVMLARVNRCLELILETDEDNLN